MAGPTSNATKVRSGKGPESHAPKEFSKKPLYLLKIFESFHINPPKKFYWLCHRVSWKYFLFVEKDLLSGTHPPFYLMFIGWSPGDNLWWQKNGAESYAIQS